MSDDESRRPTEEDLPQKTPRLLHQVSAGNSGATSSSPAAAPYQWEDGATIVQVKTEENEAPMSVDNTGPHAAVVQVVSQARNDQKIPSSAMTVIKVLATKLHTKVKSLQKASLRLRDCDERIRVLNENRVPNGAKPFNKAYESEVLDEAAFSAEHKFEIVVEAGSTYRQAMEKLYSGHMKFQAELDRRVIAAQREELRRFTKKSTFVADCLNAVKKSENTVQKLDIDWEGEEAPKLSNEQHITDQASKIYMGVLESAARELRKTELNEVSEKKKADMHADLLSKKTPLEHLRDVVTSEVVVAMKKQGKGKGNLANKSQEVAGTALIESLRNPLTKDKAKEILRSADDAPQKKPKPAEQPKNDEFPPTRRGEGARASLRRRAALHRRKEVAKEARKEAAVENPRKDAEKEASRKPRARPSLEGKASNCPACIMDE
eukprot:TRINITY_DN45199_c0_g1_i1.p2 TRINITY_DN45199_c0_g1~~TRINITY_DN45199_c0_g1_i1.p2  ORF type:complete len:435 (-),score=109.93 TRINITY_DN45199_c0_g1_i1:540-1844(-)